MHQGSPIRQATFPGTPQKADGRFFGGSFHVLLGRRASAITLVPYQQTQDLPAGSWGEAPRLLGSELGIIAGSRLAKRLDGYSVRTKCVKLGWVSLVLKRLTESFPLQAGRGPAEPIRRELSMAGEQRCFRTSTHRASQLLTESMCIGGRLRMRR